MFCNESLNFQQDSEMTVDKRRRPFIFFFLPQENLTAKLASITNIQSIWFNKICVSFLLALIYFVWKKWTWWFLLGISSVELDLYFLIFYFEGLLFLDFVFKCRPYKAGRGQLVVTRGHYNMIGWYVATLAHSWKSHYLSSYIELNFEFTSHELCL